MEQLLDDLRYSCGTLNGHRPRYIRYEASDDIAVATIILTPGIQLSEYNITKIVNELRGALTQEGSVNAHVHPDFSEYSVIEKMYIVTIKVVCAKAELDRLREVLDVIVHPFYSKGSKVIAILLRDDEQKITGVILRSVDPEGAEKLRNAYWPLVSASHKDFTVEVNWPDDKLTVTQVIFRLTGDPVSYASNIIYHATDWPRHYLDVTAIS